MLTPYALSLSSCTGQLLESGVKFERHNADRCAGAQLKNREVSFLTRILGRMTPICIFIFLKALYTVHKGPV